jgi:hypothetical protein
MADRHRHRDKNAPEGDDDDDHRDPQSFHASVILTRDPNPVVPGWRASSSLDRENAIHAPSTWPTEAMTVPR